MKDIEIIEKLLIEYGKVVTNDQISREYTNLTNINQKISLLIKKRLLVKLRKGKYYISKIGSLGYTDASSYLLANIMGEESFVSFEGALKYYGMFDQGLSKYRSISLKQYLEKNIEEVNYSYIKIKQENYFGYIIVQIDRADIKIADLERAILDLIEYNRSEYTVSLVIEKLQNYTNEIQFEKLFKYIKRYSQTTIKTLGVILDALSIDTGELKKMISSENSTHNMFSKNYSFDTKWRINYNNVILEGIR